MNKVEFTEQTIYEEIYDDFLKELEKTLDIELSNKVKEKNKMIDLIGIIIVMLCCQENKYLII